MPVNPFANVRQAISRAARWPVEVISAEWARMAPRTRKLALALLAVIVGVVVLGGSYVTFSNISTMREENDRSEERRVGKECRSRWSPYH